jgi:transposase InsO family protein
MDVTYIPMARGFVYLAAVIDWFSRKVLACGFPSPWTKPSASRLSRRRSLGMANRRSSTPSERLS